LYKRGGGGDFWRRGELDVREAAAACLGDYGADERKKPEAAVLIEGRWAG